MLLLSTIFLVSPITISPFEYVTVLISIILGMGITQLISGIAAIIIRWEKVHLYWPHSVIVLLVFVLHIQDWWATYELTKFEYWRLPTFLFLILYPVNLYVLTRILFPLRWSGKLVDLKVFYLDNFRKIYLSMTFLPAHSILDNHFIGGYSFKDQIVQITLLVILVVVVLINKREEWIHKLLAALFILITVIIFIAAWNIFLIAN
jgi:hypothetical protein